MTSISNDFKIGDKGEKQVSDELAELGYSVVLNDDESKRYDYDIKITNIDKTAEVKNDVFSAQSGNIALEYFNSKINKPSGVTVTKADFWCHIIKGKVYVATVQKLKEFIAQHKPKRTVKFAGDNNADIYLYSIQDAMKIFIPINRIGEIL